MTDPWIAAENSASHADPDVIREKGIRLIIFLPGDRSQQAAWWP